MKLESWHAPQEKRRWKIIRLDTVVEVPGDIVAADEATGDCSVTENGETKTLSFGPGGIRLIGAGR